MTLSWSLQSARVARLDRDELELKQPEWAWEVTPHHLAPYLATTSMAIAVTPDDRAASFEESRSKLQRVCDVQGKQAIPLGHIASCVRWTPTS